MTVERVAGDVETDVLGQFDGQVFLFLGHDAAGIAMHDGDRRAPVALARQAPIAQAELGHALAHAFALAKGNGGVDGGDAGLHLVAREARNVADGFGLGGHVGRATVFGAGEIIFAGFGHIGRDDGQVIFAGKFKVAFVMGRAAEDRAGAVIHQDEVGDIDGQFGGGIKRVTHAQAGVMPELLGLFDGLGGGAALSAFGTEGRYGVVLGFQFLGDGMIRRDADETCAQKRVGAGRVDFDAVVTADRIHQTEGELQAARLADPVFLHQAHLGGPIIKTVERVEQFVGHVGDLEEPLRQLATLNLGAGAPTLAVDHLFIGQNRHIDRVPVHHGVLAVDEATFQHVEEQRLLLTVVFGVAGGKHARPVDAEAKRLHLFDHGVDVLIGPIGGMPALRHGGVFGGHAKGIEPHRMQNIVPGGEFVARDHVAHRIVAHMPDMDAARGVGEHFEHVILGLVGGHGRKERAGLFPGALPFRLDLGGVVAGHLSFLGKVGKKKPGASAARRVFRRTCACGLEAPVRHP